MLFSKGFFSRGTVFFISFVAAAGLHVSDLPSLHVPSLPSLHAERVEEKTCTCTDTLPLPA